MKSYFLVLTAILASSLSLSAEMEPNDDCVSSNAIVFGIAVNGNFERNNDQDYYSFLVTQPGLIVVDLFHPDVTIQILGALYESSCTGHAFYAKQNNYNFGKYHFNICTPGLYYLRISSGDHTINLQEYTLTITMNYDDTFECNNSFTTAASIPFNTILTALMAGYSDEDYYSFFVPDKGKLDIDLPSVPHDSDFILHVILYDSIGNFITQDCICGNTWITEYIQTIICDPGTYNMLIREWHGKKSLEPYKFIVKFTPDSTECNEDDEHAFHIENNQVITAYSGGPNASSLERDVDYYSFNVPSPGVLDLNINRKDTFHYQISVFNPDKKQVIFTDYNKNGLATWHNLALCDVGRHTIQLIDKTPDDCSKRKNKFTEYQFNLQNVYPDENECNNTTETATSVTGNEIIYGALASYRDTDFYKITLQKSDTLYISIDSMPSELFCEEAIFLKKNIKLQSLYFQDSTRIQFVNPTTTNDFYIRLFTVGFETSYHPYKLTLNKRSFSTSSYSETFEALNLISNVSSDLLHLSETEIESARKIHYQIINSLGMISQPRTSLEAKSTIDISQLSYGLYTLILYKGNIAHTYKFIKI